ncbi:hypothetical protein [Lactiplantibacillus paraplantarum]|nr:hypothetical protein [Lactiplantibacillus paraplantarum]WEE36612.1 hypothetical protein PWO93_03185 [Lactiplantibacillus paraplantarum]
MNKILKRKKGGLSSESLLEMAIYFILLSKSSIIAASLNVN